MPHPPRTFLGYDESRSVPNIVVDGSPNESTVLTLSHWPGMVQPAGTDVDTSAEMAFAYLDEPVEHEPASVVTNNHFDQDGAVGIFALISPEEALAHRDLLVDLARAGDFGTYRLRNSARASMVLSAMADASTPLAARLCLDAGADTAALYEAALPRLIGMLTDPAEYIDQWGAEDDVLSESERAIADGHVQITEDTDLDLAVVEIDPTQPERVGHRFGHMQVGPIHQMAVNNATTCSRILMVHGRRFTYIDRYETWVQVHTTAPPKRRDLQPLAEVLSASEDGGTVWSAGAPSGLTPTLQHEGDSRLDKHEVISRVRHHLETAPPAWDPYRPA